MQTQNIPYLPRLDHLRFYAAFLVFLFHFYHFASGSWVPGSTDNILIAIANEGYAGVSLFFVLSGFIFTLIGYGKEIRYKNFMINRFLRIFPLFLFMFFIAISASRDQFNPSDVFYIFFSNLGHAPTSNTLLTGAAWSISIEFTFYMIFPFLVAFYSRYGARYLLKIILIMILVRYGAYLMFPEIVKPFYSTLLGRLDQFLIGMLYAGLYLKHKQIFSSYLHLAFSAVLLLAAFWYLDSNISMLSGDAHMKQWVVWLTVEAALWGYFMLAYLTVSARYGVKLGRYLCKMGEMSYSIYLMHTLIVVIWVKKIGVITIVSNPQYNLLLNSLMAFPLVLLLAHLSYTTIERPFLTLRRRYAF